MLPKSGRLALAIVGVLIGVPEPANAQVVMLEITGSFGRHFIPTTTGTFELAREAGIACDVTVEARSASSATYTIDCTVGGWVHRRAIGCSEASGGRMLEVLHRFWRQGRQQDFVVISGRCRVAE